MGLLSWLGIGKKPESFQFPVGTTCEQANEILASKLDTKAEVERCVFDILRWAQDRKAKGKSRMKVYDFGFDQYDTDLTPTQEGIIARLEELHLRTDLEEEDYINRGRRHQNRWLVVSW